MIGALRSAVSRFFAADGLLLAAGLAFFFLVCLIPLMLLAVATVGFLLSTEHAAPEMVGQLARNFPVYQREIERALLRIVETRTVSGLLGTAILIFVSTPLFSAARLALHRLLGVRGGGNFLRNLLADAATALLLGPLLLAAAVVTWVFDWLQEFVLEPAQVPRQWIRAAVIGVSLALSAAMFHLAYRYVPRRGVRAGAALAGALLATLLWEVAKQLFRLYIRRVGLYDEIYGPLGVLVAFVMFVYYSAIVFLLGGAYVAAVDARRR